MTPFSPSCYTTTLPSHSPFPLVFFISIFSLTFPSQSQLSSSHAMSEPLPPSPPPLQQPHETASPDFNLAVIIAAMLCAFLCALGLQCVFRCARRALTEPIQWAASREQNSGLKKKDMVALPTSTYSNSGSPSSSSSRSSACAICLAEFADGEKIRVLPKCNHWFHVSCIDKWLLSHPSCPTCRNQLKSINVPLPCLETVITL